MKDELKHVLEDLLTDCKAYILRNLSNLSLPQEALSGVHLEVKTPDVWIIASMLYFHICVDHFIAFSDLCSLYVWSIWYISKSMHLPHE